MCKYDGWRTNAYLMKTRWNLIIVLRLLSDKRFWPFGGGRSFESVSMCCRVLWQPLPPCCDALSQTFITLVVYTLCFSWWNHGCSKEIFFKGKKKSTFVVCLFVCLKSLGIVPSASYIQAYILTQVQSSFMLFYFEIWLPWTIFALNSLHGPCWP